MSVLIVDNISEELRMVLSQERTKRGNRPPAETVAELVSPGLGNTVTAFLCIPPESTYQTFHSEYEPSIE